MNIYVAGKIHDIATVREVQKIARLTGHEITYDWTQMVEKAGGPERGAQVDIQLQREAAQRDTAGVYLSDLVIAIGHPWLCGTLIEVGMALAWNKRLWTLYWDRCSRQSVFTAQEQIRHFTDPAILYDALLEISPNSLRWPDTIFKSSSSYEDVRFEFRGPDDEDWRPA